MAWTGFGGSWSDGVHSGGDDSGSIGGGGIRLDGKGNPLGTRAPSAGDIANQYNSYGGTQITAAMVSNIRPDGLGMYTADISGGWTSTGVEGSTRDSTSAAGFTGVSVPNTDNGKGLDGGVSNWNDAANLVRAGKIPSNFKLKDGKIGIMIPEYREERFKDGGTRKRKIGEKFIETPALTTAYNEGIKEREEYKKAIKLTADFFKEIGEKAGATQAAIAKELAAAAKGKKIKNVDQALAAFNKHKNALNAKYSVADRKAITLALKSLNRSQVSKNLKAFSKAAGLVSLTMDGVDLALELKKAIETDNYRSFFVKATSLLAGYEAGLLTAWAFSIILGTPLGILGFAIIMAAASALIDEKLVEKVISAGKRNPPKRIISAKI